MMAKPHGVRVKVCYDNSLRKIYFAFGFKPRNYFGWQKMGANGKIFDPAHPVRDAYVATAIVMALLGAGAAGALLGDDDD